MLKYMSIATVFQEVPDEISLAINISGCVHRCPRCHSPELRQNIGQKLLKDFPSLLEWYAPYISCVCFMGGDHNQKEQTALCRQARTAGLKTCLYTGCDQLDEIESDLLQQQNYLKIGHYDEEKGPINKRTTNQRMYRITTQNDLPVLTDITERFWKKELL